MNETNRKVNGIPVIPGGVTSLSSPMKDKKWEVAENPLKSR